MKKLIFITTTLIFLFSCGNSNSPGPKTFNSSAISIFTQANKILDDFDAKITAAVKGNNVESLSAEADQALLKVDEQIEKMKAINAPEHGEEYKEAVLSSLEKLKSIVETGKKYSELKEGYSKKEFNALEKEYNNKRKDLSQQLSKVAKVQADFAKKTGKK